MHFFNKRSKGLTIQIKKFTAFFGHIYQGCRYVLAMTVYKLGVYYLQIIKFLNLDSPKNENCHNLLNIVIPSLSEFLSSVEHNLRNSRNVCPYSRNQE